MLHTVEGTGNISCDLDTKTKVKGHILHFPVNASPP